MNGRPFLEVFFRGVGGIDLILEVRRLRRVSSWEVRANPPPLPPQPRHPYNCRIAALSKKVGVLLLQLQVLCEEMCI